MKNTVKFLFSLILPFTVVIIIPLAIEDDFAVRRDLLSMAGALLGVFGLALLVLTVSMFARLGNGTLAPWVPPTRLVIAGVYSHVRNPMITGVIAILGGESLVFRSNGILIWAFVFFRDQ